MTGLLPIPVEPARLTLTLPYPPSANRYWRSLVIKGSGRVVLSKDGKEYRLLVWAATRRVEKFRGRLAVTIWMCAPDARERDVDNIQKPLLDALQHAGMYDRDSQIDDLRTVRGALARPRGRVDVEIREIGP